MKKKISDMIKQNRILFVIIILEMLFLAWTGMQAMIREPYVKVFGPDELNFDYDRSEGVYQDESGAYIISNEEQGTAAEAWKTYDFQVQEGRYRIIVDYVAENTIAEDNWVRVYSIAARNYYSNDYLYLHDYNTVSEVDIEALSKTSDLNVVVHYGGQGTLGIKSIRVEENVSYRLGRFLQDLLLFVCFDILYLLFFGSHVIRVSQERRRIAYLLFGTVIFASFPMFTDFAASGHDSSFHLCRIQGIADALKNGQFPVRNYITSYSGYGYASPLFYGEILLYIPALLSLLGIPLYRVYQLYVIMVNAATCIISYVCFKNIFRSQKAGVLASFLYTCSAYRIVNILHRWAVGEFSAMMFLPLIVYAAWIMASKESSRTEQKYAWLYLGMGMTGIIQTHIISVEMTVVFLGIFCILFWKRIMKMKNLLSLCKAVLITVLLNLWFVIPFLQYYNGYYFVNTRVMKSLDVSALYLQQIFGVFFKGSGVNIWNGMKGEMPLTIGFALTLGLLGLITLRVFHGKWEGRMWKLGFYTGALGGAAIWMTSVYFPWYKIKEWSGTLGRYVIAMQFPWRYLTIATVLLSVTAVCFVFLVKQRYGRKAGMMTAALLAAVNILTVGYYYTDFFDQYTEETDISKLDDRFYMDNLYFPVGLDSDDFVFYEPKCEEGITIDTYYADRGDSVVTCKNETQQERMMTFPLAYYPDYRVTDEDGQELSLFMGDDQLVTVALPAGYSGTLHVKFTSQPIWRVAEVISLLTAAAVITWVIVSKQKEKTKKRVTAGGEETGIGKETPF